MAKTDKNDAHLHAYLFLVRNGLTDTAASFLDESRKAITDAILSRMPTKPDALKSYLKNNPPYGLKTGDLGEAADSHMTIMKRRLKASLLVCKKQKIGRNKDKVDTESSSSDSSTTSAAISSESSSSNSSSSDSSDSTTSDSSSGSDSSSSSSTESSDDSSDSDSNSSSNGNSSPGTLSDSESNSSSDSEKSSSGSTSHSRLSKKASLESHPNPPAKPSPQPAVASIPFQRVDASKVNFAREELRSNHFLDKKGAQDSYGQRAYHDLAPTRGKGFRQEKNKKKRGSYRGGQIDTQVHSIKFDYD